MQSALVVGDTLNFTTSVADYLPSAGWTLKFRLVPRSAGSAITITTSQDSTDSSLHRAQVAAATTAAWTAGEYSWHSYVEKAAESYSVSSGQVTLKPDPRVAATLDNRSTARIALDQAKAAFAAWTPTTKRYTIGDRSMEFNAAADILPLISYWQTQVKAEENAARIAAGLKSGRQVYVRTGRA